MGYIQFSQKVKLEKLVVSGLAVGVCILAMILPNIRGQVNPDPERPIGTFTVEDISKLRNYHCKRLVTQIQVT
jgi:hypothetical protein